MSSCTFTGGVVVAVLFAASVDAGQGPGFAPGWNGKAERPPLGWRAWNAFGATIHAGLPGDGSNCSSPPAPGGSSAAGAAAATRVGRAPADPPLPCGSIARTIDLLTAKTWRVGDGDGGGGGGGGALTSLADVGYRSVGIDEGWEACGFGVNGTGHHDAAGNPLINPFKFPDMAALVAYGRARGLSLGWYLNGCACPDRHELDANYAGDVAALRDLGFEGAKFDGCGALRNGSKYAALMRATGKNFSIENCHWGAGGFIGCIAGDDASACPTEGWSPFNWYRAGGDIGRTPDGWFDLLQNVAQFALPFGTPLSRPYSWAYPDMLQVGNVLAADGKTLDVPWNRAHFGAWCVVSSPLILSLDLDSPALPLVVPFITNPEAIAVNQAWAGNPGMLLLSRDPKNEPPPPPPPPQPQQQHSLSHSQPADPPPAPHSLPDALGFVQFAGMLNARDDGGRPLRVANATLAQAEAWCNRSAKCTCFTSLSFAGGAPDDTAHEVRFENAPKLCASNGIHVRDGNKAWATYVKAPLVPAAAEDGAQQVWGKPQPGGGWALFFVNSDAKRTMSVSVNLTAVLPGGSGVHLAAGGAATLVRDVWARAAAPALAPTNGVFAPPSVQPRDSAFYVLSLPPSPAAATS